MDQTTNTKYPRAFYFVIDEVTYAKQFLANHALADNFHPHLSPKAMQKVRSLQTDAEHFELSNSERDDWQYVWGNKQFKSKK